MPEALRQFLAMGGYAGFVWPAYAVAFVVLGGMVLQGWRRYRAGLRALAEMQRRIDSAP